MLKTQDQIPYSGKRWQEKTWRIQLSGLFGRENFGEWPLPCAANLNGRYMLSAVIQRRFFFSEMMAVYEHTGIDDNIVDDIKIFHGTVIGINIMVTR